VSSRKERPSRLPAPKQSQRKVRPSRRQLALEPLETRCLLSGSGYRPIAEVANNVANPTWGTAGTDLVRLTPTYYANGYNSPSLAQDPSARLVSNILNNQADPANPTADIATVDQQSLSDFGYAFGQFMDHDMDLTLNGNIADPISVPPGDPIGGPNGTPLVFNRSVIDPATGTGPGDPAQNPNFITSYLDLSQVYGSDLTTDLALRTLAGGQLKTSPGGLPPLNNLNYFTATQLAQINAAAGGMQDGGPSPPSDIFVTGDVRGNENVELTALQTVFLDNHNRIAALLQQEHPSWTDEQLFQEARKINIADYQSIVYNEWIPAVFGGHALAPYAGYNPNVNVSISNEFSTVAFRFGHSLLSGNIERAGNNGLPVADSVPLNEDFFDPTILNGQGQPSTTDPVTGLTTTDIGAILKGDADGDSQAMDLQAINEVRNELFNENIPGVGFGQDLIALDVQRARDHGIGSYNQVRVALGLPAVTSFSQITSNVQVQNELQAAYGSVDNIDAFEGGLAEDKVPGSDVGPLFQTIMVQQFENLRDGDRYFYRNENWSPDELALLSQGNTLTKVIEANTDITNLQSNVFLFKASISGTVLFNPFQTSGKPNGLGLPGITVQLEDTSGDVLATTVTNIFGHYTFNQLSGPAANPENSSGVSGTGYYQVVLTLPSWLQQFAGDTSPILISRGGLNVTGVDFGVGFNLSAVGSHGTMALSNAAGAAAATDSSNSLLVRALTTSSARNTATVSLPPAQSSVRQITVTGAVQGAISAKAALVRVAHTGTAAANGLDDDLGGQVFARL
jgi:hypothetical protein